LSELAPATLTVPPTLAPPTGELIATEGAVVSAVVLLTVTETPADRTLPDVSVARAVSVCEPLARPVVSHDHDHDAVPVAVCQAPPSTWIATDATETLSDAEPDTVTVPPTVAPAVGAENETLGAVVSPLLIVTDSMAVELLPSESVARASSVCDPLV
jgi:hypothetical protein